VSGPIWLDSASSPCSIGQQSPYSHAFSTHGEDPPAQRSGIGHDDVLLPGRLASAQGAAPSMLNIASRSAETGATPWSAIRQANMLPLRSTGIAEHRSPGRAGRTIDQRAKQLGKRLRRRQPADSRVSAFGHSVPSSCPVGQHFSLRSPSGQAQRIIRFRLTGYWAPRGPGDQWRPGLDSCPLWAL
jgi:hypothetical protein